MTALIDTLFQIEKYLGLELDSLMPYADMDDIGGYHPDEAQRKWWTGAIWEVEGKTLYAVIRALKPHTIVEIGSGTGCSSTHMAAALKANGGGHVTTVDRGNTPQIPADLQAYVTIEAGDGIDYLALLPDNSVDFILEDADHTTDMCHAIGELAKTKLKPGGVLMAHDAAHFAVGAEVKAGYDLAGLDFRVYLTDPSDCGWAVWKKPMVIFNNDAVSPDGGKTWNPNKEKMQGSEYPPIDFSPLQAQEEYPDVVSEAPAPKKVKRTRKAKPARGG